MDPVRLAALAADLRRFLELPDVRQECFGQFEPTGSAYRKALEAVAALELEAAEK